MFNLKGKSIVFVMVLSLISQVSAVTVSAATLTLNSIAKVDTNNYKINDLEVEGLDEATMVAVSVDKGYFKVTENSSLYSVNYDILPEHKSVIIIFNNKLSMSQVKSILQNNITYTVNNGETQKVSIKISNNDTKIPNEATVTMKDSNGIMHYYIYVNNLSQVFWTDAYNKAKEYRLDGLKGYLATITSKEEDDVLKRISTSGAWSGGTRLSFNEEYDSDKLTINSEKFAGEDFVWACGPEKGQVYYEGKENGINKYESIGNGERWGWQSGEPNNLYNAETCMQVNFSEERYWNDLHYDDETISGFFVEFSSYGDNVGDSSKRISATRTTTQASLRDKEELQINDIGFNYIDRKLTKLTNGKYSVDGNIVNITNGCLDISDKLGKSITLIKCGDGVKTIDSNPATINIKDKIPESNVTYNIKQPTYVTRTGTLNIPDTEEYSVDDGKTWLSPIEGKVEGLAEDSTVLVRIKATEDSPESYEVKVGIRKAPIKEVIDEKKLIFDYKEKVITGLVDGKYKVNDKLKEIDNNRIDISKLLGTTLSLVKCGDGVKTIDSNPATINIKDKIPESNVTYNIKQPTYVTRTGTLNIPDTEEYSVDDGKTWLSPIEGKVEGLAEDSTVLVRIKATEDSPESYGVKVDIRKAPIREVIDETKLIFDYKEKVITGLVNGKYKVNDKLEEINNNKIDISKLLGTTLSLVKCGDNIDTIDSEEHFLNIRSLAEAPDVSEFEIEQPSYENPVGTLLGVKETEEYSLDEGKTWLSGTGKNIENLKPDSEVYIRTKATKNSPESNAVKVKIKALPEREVISKESVTINDFNEKSADNSSNKTVRNKIKTSDTAPIASLSVIALLSGLVAFIKRKKDIKEY